MRFMIGGRRDRVEIWGGWGVEGRGWGLLCAEIWGGWGVEGRGIGLTLRRIPARRVVVEMDCIRIGSNVASPCFLGAVPVLKKGQ